MKLLVTGSLGLVGSACVETFAAKGWDVTGIDNNGRAQFFGTEDKRGAMPVDIRNEAAVNKLFTTGLFFDAIIHTAGQPSHDYATDHVLEDFHVNATGTLHLLEATRKYCPEAVFVHVSTDKVYGENMFVGLNEGSTRYEPMNILVATGFEGFKEDLGLDFAGDRSFFGCSKAAADMYAQQYAARFGMKVGIFRPGCITGKNHAGAKQHGFLAYLAKCIKEGKTYTIYGNGKTVRDQIHASDLASAFYAFCENPKAGAVYNIGGGPERSVSVLEAIKLIEKAAVKKAIIEYGEERLGDRRWDIHDVSKFRKDYPEWDYQYSLNDIINDLAWDGFL